MRKALRVLRFFGPDMGGLVLAMVLLGLSLAAGLLKPWPLALIVDSLLGSRPLPEWLAGMREGLEPARWLPILAGLAVLAYVLHAVLSAAYAFVTIRIGLRGLGRIRSVLFQWLQRLSLRYHQGARQGDLVYRATWNTYSFQTLFQQGWCAALSAALSLLLMILVMARIDPVLTIIALGTVPLLLAVMRVFGRQMHRRSLAAQQADSRVASRIQQNIAALALVQGDAQESREAERFRVESESAYRTRLSQHGWEVLYLASVGAIFGLGIGAIVWQGAHQVWAGRLTLGELLVFIAYVGQFYEPLNQLSHVGSTVADASAGIDRVFEILDTPEEVRERPNARPAVAARSGGSVASASVPGPRSGSSNAPVSIRGSIDFQKVGFAYEAGRPVLQEITFHLEAGCSAALVGPSGAGKSTLIHLLPRFFDPDSGAVRLDGHDLRDLRLADLRSLVALVMQEPLLLPATIAENIAYARPEAAEAEIHAAARAAQAHEFILRLPRQYETVVGEGAVRISTGEKQRLSLARAFLKNAPVILLDEPASALDPENAIGLAASLRNMIGGRTVLIAAHRWSTIQHVDLLLVLRAGRLVECGPPADLLRHADSYLHQLISHD
ncbi:MAG TPA: ABC transporter ATP-binding protein [Candidatus Paceibacterota bacterium]|nr:ABC transporter ATP-binding protein [Verrucomicrobiota bacterium]HOX04720.1 ABC transporter ATP-binding protein [Verrucomicrobiota bacterium]HRZ47689.1 ABC transporter ATP-binding protein [Candidatus Paceibacterota bacterium]HRZ94055.1 ABC transporter ATP-binding protein [Candidatus Paceibacterota bacterium]